MNGIHSFIVSPYNGRRYDNIVKYGDVELVTSVSEEDHTVSNRFAVVKELPLGYKGDIKKGDLLVVHHNIFKYYNNIKGNRSSSSAFFKDDLFFVGYDQFYLYGNPDNWKCHDRYCFVKPIKSENKSCIYEPLIGEMKYVNSTLASYGLKQGDKICFAPDSEYFFTINNEQLYRIYDHQICGKI